MSDIFKEVDDALKQEKVEQFWSKHKHLIIGGIVAIIVATGIYSTYIGWLHGQQEEKTAVILDLYTAPEEFDLERLSQLNPSQKSLADLFLARKYLQEENNEEAFQTFETVRTNEGTDINIRGLSAYYARNMVLNQKIEGDLSDITLPIASIWDGHLKLQNALNLGSRQNNPTEAIVILDEIIAENPENQSLLQQARQLKYVYEYDMQQKQE